MPVSSKKYLIRLVILLVILGICIGVYSSRAQTYPETPNTSVYFTNPYTLKDWAPDSVYNSSLAHIGYYLGINNIAGTQLAASDPHYDSDGSLSFEFTLDQGSEVYAVTVETVNYGGGISSSAVSVNGDSAAYNVATQLYGAGFTDFDSLVDEGLSASQVYGIQRQLTRFDGGANFGVDTTTISQSPSTTNTRTIFNITINGQPYRVINDSSDINTVHVQLFDTSGHQIFDSGVVSLAG